MSSTTPVTTGRARTRAGQPLRGTDPSPDQRSPDLPPPAAHGHEPSSPGLSPARTTERARRDRVLKVGGAGLDDPAHLDRLVALVANARDAGDRMILVHGGGCEIAALHARLGIGTTTVDGLRATPESAIDGVVMVLGGLVNARLVAHLRRRGVEAIGVRGLDLGWRSVLRDPERLGRVGGPPTVDASTVRALADQVDVLVLAPVCLGHDGGPVNVNADEVARAVAIALEARELDLVTDVPHVRRGATPVPRLHPADVEPLVRDGIVAGGMIPKLRAAAAAVERGVDRVRIGTPDTLRHGGATEIRT